MPTRFPFLINNFEAKLAVDQTSDDAFRIRPEDMTVLWAALQAIDYTDPVDARFKSFKFTAIHPSALDAYGRLVDPTKTRIFHGAVTDPTTNSIEIVPAYGGQAESSGGLGFEGIAPAGTIVFPVGSTLRCEVTAGLFTAIYKAINLLEAQVGTGLPS